MQKNIGLNKFKRRNFNVLQSVKRTRFPSAAEKSYSLWYFRKYLKLYMQIDQAFMSYERYKCKYFICFSHFLNVTGDGSKVILIILSNIYSDFNWNISQYLFLKNLKNVLVNRKYKNTNSWSNQQFVIQKYNLQWFLKGYGVDFSDMI